jgi:octaprenyl-diphosphate synthase
VTSRATPPLTPSLRDIQGPVLDRLDEVVEELRRIITADFGMVEEVSRYLLLLKGKMFRPTLTLLASAVEGRPEARATTLAAILELVHLATLVHDDSVDHSVRRRGMPTLNSVFSHQVAVIMGDFLYSRAVVELVRLGDLQVLRVLADATNEMTVGEMRQLGALDALAFSEQDYDVLIRAKTASLLSAACAIGALAGARAHAEALARYGANLGMAFQIADDLLDYTADEAVIGKPHGGDLREHKVTLPLIHAMRSMTEGERGEVEALFADPEPDSARIERVVGIVADRGGLDYAHRRGVEFAERAEEALADLPESPAAASLRHAVAYALDRSR